jgi:O-antigen/teichoic acid export membrane protein
MLETLRAVYDRLTADGSTEEQAVRSGIWAAGINVGDRVLQLLKVVVLARLLSPTAFGLLGIGLLTLAALNQFSRLGFDQALVQRPEEDVDEYLNTAWVMKIARGLLLSVVAFALAPHLAAFFGEPRAEPVIRVLGVSPLLLGLQNPAVVYFQKNLDFHREFVYRIGGRLVDLVVAVAFVLVYRNVWALVAGLIASKATMVLLSYAIHQYRPRVSFDPEYGREMFGFGKWLFASGILVFLYGQGDDAFVGWFFGATALGFYQIAYRLSNAPASEITGVISRVAFPALSKVQDDVDRLREGYFRSVQMAAVVGFPVAAGIATVAPQFVGAVLGTEWEPIVPLMQLLAVWGGIRAFGANVGAVFKSVGRPDYDTKLQAIKVAIIAILIYPAAEQFGVLGVASVIVGNSFVIQPISIYLVLSIVEGSLARLLSVVIYPLSGSALMAGVVVLIDTYVLAGTGVIELSVLVAAGVASYVGIMLTLERSTGCEFVSIYRTLRRAV